ncbi:uncharacterized protein TRIVIDRAFT_29345 [Trichoderma virens Gv29-8]|uniref:DUF676 domain-containing protein n=1 Tax=Hypocrea virens (strain Gv29-8 / FGSC 10586) TaxID=413071 RepID=G9MRM7_HYPVG|nr:uncharacterized protein TRIVIDRAFT_29345 [Trichoderma virens Gv29-8]EHK22748.1 hypothetical protein TRIVIDRAFT_29345 [Trichoderma virens Gv29-8]UKZ47801.1 hypothetical protein TrVGV298_002031 [Trichoderma virens]
MQQHPSQRTTFRVRRVPLDWSVIRLRSCLEQHDPSSCPVIKSFVPEVDRRSFTATVVYKSRPLVTQHPKPWDLSLEGPHGNPSSNSGYLAIDDDLLGITSLYLPEAKNYKVDIIALGNISGRPLESFEDVASNHVWLRDILPAQFVDAESRQPMVRVMIYGYQSVLDGKYGRVTLEALGTAFVKVLTALGNSSQIKPTILIGHGVGGLVIKQVALITLSKLRGETEMNIFRAIRGVVFFGVPHDGMDITSLQLTAGHPNQQVIDSLRQGGSELLNQMHAEFIQAFSQKPETEIFSFYETLESEITPPIGDSTLQYQEQHDNSHKNTKSHAGVVVTRASATHCRPETGNVQQTCAIPRSNADLARFEPHDPDYDAVRNVLFGITQRAVN